MAIRKWHVGKVVMLWAWGILLCALLIRLIIGTADALAGLVLILSGLAILIALSVITWKWFSGKEPADR